MSDLGALKEKEVQLSPRCYDFILMMLTLKKQPEKITYQFRTGTQRATAERKNSP